MLALLSALFVTIMLASLLLWASALGRVGKGLPILDRDPHPLPRWGFVDILAAVIALIVVQVIAGLLLRSGELLSTETERTLDDYYVTLMTSVVCSMLAFGASWGWVAWRTGSTAADLGFRSDRVGRDILIGVAAFVMLAPLVFAVQLVLVQIMGPTKHPLILLLQESPQIRLFVAASLNAVMVAPIVEEYFFRGLWQGWTESLRLPLVGEEALFGQRGPTAVVVSDSSSKFVSPGEEGSLQNPYIATIVDDQPLLATVVDDSLPAPTIWWPILLSAVLFALAHFSHGPDGAALFVLAVGLGYVYQRTRSLLPSIIVHFLLNATSMVMLWVQLYAKP